MSNEDELPELDDETRRLLEERLAWNLQAYAVVCADDIRRDYEREAREALARGASPHIAAGEKVDPVMERMSSNAPYLTRDEEEWFKEFRFDDEWRTGSGRAVIGSCALLMVFVILVSIIGFATGGFVLMLAVAMGPMLMWKTLGPYVRRKSVQLMGPIGCAYTPPSAMMGLTFGFVLTMFSLALYPIMGNRSLLFASAAVTLSLLWYAIQYFRLRNRIKTHYDHVWKIIGLPDE